MEFSEPRGIYLQIADQIRDRILQGEWQSGERIPSIRELAIELGVNPNTVTKSYQALLDWGIVRQSARTRIFRQRSGSRTGADRNA